MEPRLILHVLILYSAALLLLHAIWYVGHRRGLLQSPALLALCIAAGFWAWLSPIEWHALWPEAARFQYAVTAIVPSLWAVFAITSTRHQHQFTFWPQLIVLTVPLISLGLLITTEGIGAWPAGGIAAGISPAPWLGLWLHALLSLALLLASALLLITRLWLMVPQRPLHAIVGIVLAILPVGAFGMSIGAGALSYTVPNLTPILSGISGLILWIIIAPARPSDAAPPQRATADRTTGRSAATPPPVQPALPTIMSHELRTLMSSIVSASEMLERTKLDSEQQALITILRTSGHAVLDVINTTLEIATLEVAQLTLHQAPFSLHSCVEHSLDTTAIEALNKQIHVSYVIADSVPDRLIGDSTRLGQVLLNLVSNGVKFTTSGGVLVSISSSLLDDQRYEVRFAVTDSGPGIAEDQRKLLFQPFSRIISSPADQKPGSGLGLFISRQLAILMGGDLSLEHSSPSGSTFTFTIKAAADPHTLAPPRRHPALINKRLLLVGASSPCRIMVATMAAQWGMLVRTADQLSAAQGLINAGSDFDTTIVIQDDAHDTPGPPLQRPGPAGSTQQPLPAALITWLGIGDHTSSDRLHTYTEVCYQPIHHADLCALLLRLVGAIAADPHPGGGPTGSRSTTPLQIVLADDHDLSRSLAGRMLQSLGHMVSEAGTAAAAFTILRRQHCDILLLDMDLAGDSGLSVAHRISKIMLPEQPPYIIALTGEYRSAPTAQHRAAGIHTWLVKPLTYTSIAEALAAYERWRVHQVALALAHLDTWDEPQDQLGPSYNTTFTNLHQQYGLPAHETQVFVDQYLDDTEQLVREMHLALRMGNTNNIARAAHKLKSSSAIFSEHRLTHLCHELDTLARASTFTDYDHYIQLIETEYHRVRARLHTAR